jgi:glutamate transport system permease protein
MSSVLYDAPGPRARLRNRLLAVVGTVVLIALAGLVIYRLASKGQLDGAMWDIFNYAGVRDSIADGLLSTLQAFVMGGVLSLVLGVLLAVGRLSAHRPVSWVATGFIELFRAVPLLITIYVLWVGFFTSDPLWAVVIGLALYNGAVQAEVLRAGINAVPAGQREAAYAIGMSKTQVMTSVLIPQAVRSMLPTIVSQLVVTLKDTSLGFVITYEELLYAGRQMASTILVDGENPYVPVVLVFGALYVTLCLALSALANRIERRGRRTKTGIRIAEAEQPAPDMGGAGGGLVI